MVVNLIEDARMNKNCSYQRLAIVFARDALNDMVMDDLISAQANLNIASDFIKSARRKQE